MTSPSIVAVVGATGNQGGAVVRALGQDTGRWHIRALTRDIRAAKARALAGEGIEVVRADLDDIESLRQAFAGAHGVFSVTNFRDGGVAREEQRGKRVADAAGKAEVRHLVYSSVGGADRDSGVPHFESKWHVEQHLERTGVPYSVVRPTTFMTNLMEMPAVMRFLALSMWRSSMERPLQMIAISDIGRWVAHMLDNPAAYLGKAVEIAGDEVAFPGMISAYERVYGSRPATMPLPTSMFLRGDQGRMFTWISQRGYRADLPANRAAIPDLLTFERFLALKQPT